VSKIILITGASTGIGAGTARYLAKDNTIIVHYNSSKNEAEKVAEEVVSNGGKAHLVRADLATKDGCVALIENVSQTVDRLDVLVNNAGGLIKRHQTRAIEWELMERIFSLNVFSVMQLSSLCIPLLESGAQPCIINITSMAIRLGVPTSTIYGAAKSAIDAFTRGMARELAPTIRVNAVAPGIIDTPFHEKVTSPDQMERWKEATPLKMFGQSIHVAMAIKMLIENDFMTGETIDVNGGLSMR
jgi:3-oxoacyl-[acyl-carrier protein] reductase